MAKDFSLHFSLTMPNFVTQYSMETEEILQCNNHNNDDSDIVVLEILTVSTSVYHASKTKNPP